MTPASSPQRPPRTHLDVTRLKRLLARGRAVSKWRTVRASGATPWRHPRHVLTSPEVESFSYALADPREVCGQVAAALGTTVERQLAHLAELATDVELGARLRAETRWRWTVRTAPPLGNRVAWHLLARTLRPSTIVETGIYDGLGSRVLLRALARNAAEGHDGRLVSVDPDPWSGSLVPDRLHDRWTVVRGTSTEDLEPALRGREVGLLFSDSPHTRENQEAEYAIARRHAAARLALVDCSGGWCPVLAELADETGAPLHSLVFRSRDHFYAGGSGLLVLDR